MSRRWIASLTSTALLFGALPVPFHPALIAPAHAQGNTQSPMQVQIYGVEQLDAILAPIALYPDPLLSQILMAVAYPDQLSAARPVAEDAARRGLRGSAVEQAVIRMDWDPSVKSLAPFPQVLVQLTEHQEWAQQIAYAVAVQQPDVLDSVQRLRQAAWRSGHLRSTSQLRVRTESVWIYIEPAQPTMVYVPVYNPTVVYGGWAYPSYPPVYYPPPRNYVPDSVLASGIGFAVGVAVAATLWDISRPRWQERNIWVDTTRYNHINPQRPPMREQRWTPPTEHIREGSGFRPPPRGTIGEPVRPAQISQPGAPAVALPAEPGRGPGGSPRRDVAPGTGAGPAPGNQPVPPAGPGRIAPREGQQVMPPPPAGGAATTPTEPPRRGAPTMPGDKASPAIPGERAAPAIPPAPQGGAVTMPNEPPRRGAPAMPAERATPAVPAERAIPGMPGSRATPAAPAERAMPATPPAAPGASQGGAPPMGTNQERHGGGQGGGNQGPGGSPPTASPPARAAPQGEAAPPAQSTPRPESGRQRPDRGQGQQTDQPAGNERR